MFDDHRTLEGQTFELKKKVSTFIAKLVQESFPLEHLIEMLGYTPSDFIDIETVRRKGAGSVKHLKIEKLTERLIQDALQKRNFTLPSELKYIDEVISPPDTFEKTIEPGDGSGVEKEIIPRTVYVADVLTELGLDYEVSVGKINSEMVRNRGYFSYHIKERNIVILVNNEEGNATRIVWSDTEIDDEMLKEIMRYTKSQLDTQKKFIVEKVEYPGSEEAYKDVLRRNILLENVFSAEKSDLRSVAEGERNSQKGVYTHNSLAKELGIHRAVLTTLLSSLKGYENFIHAERVGEQIFYTYDVEIKNKLEALLQEQEPLAPKEWVTIVGLVKKFQRDLSEINKYFFEKVVKKFLNLNIEEKKNGDEEEIADTKIIELLANKGIVLAEHYKKFRIAHNKSAYHFSPQLQIVLKEYCSDYFEKIKNTPEAPVNWLTPQELAEKIAQEKDVSTNVQDLAHVITKQIKIKKSEIMVYDANTQQGDYGYFKVRGQNRINVLHFSPSFSERLRREFGKKIEEKGKYELAPDGWRSINSFSELLRKELQSSTVLAILIKKVNAALQTLGFELGDENFKIYIDQKKHMVASHLSPMAQDRVREIVRIEVQEFEKIPYAPSNWQTRFGIVQNIIGELQSLGIHYSLAKVRGDVDKAWDTVKGNFVAEEDYGMRKKQGKEGKKMGRGANLRFEFCSTGMTKSIIKELKKKYFTEEG